MIMTDDLLIQQLRELRYPGRVDVTEAVMADVCKRPLLVSESAKPKWSIKRISAVAASLAILLVSINFVTIFTRSYDSAQLATDIASVYDFHADYASNSNYYESYLVDALLN
jgi:hypothetical protein